MMMSTFILAFFGFFFWIVCSRFYSTEQIGLATNLLSVNSFIMTLSMLGFSNSLIRYLPITKNKNDLINTVFTLVAIAALIITGIYLFNINFFTPKLSFLVGNPTYLILFILVILVSSVNNVSDSVFVAYRSTLYILLYNIGQAVAKLSLPIILVSLQSFGIFLSVGGGVTMAITLTLFFLITKFKYRPYITINKEMMKETFTFSFINYLAGFIGGLPPMILPLVITNKLGASYSAYFYMAMMITTLLYIIPQSITRSLFAESSHNEKDVRKFITKAIKMLGLFMIPAVAIIVFFGQYILLAFGKKYSMEGYHLLQYFAISGLLVSFSSAAGIVFNIKNRLKTLLVISILNSGLIIIPSILLPYTRLIIIGQIWLVAHIVVALVGFILLRKEIFTNNSSS